ncbi:hypothetical protein L7F22_066303 [Adiantum nelumboides]|nr:hypothetical protein [Adiantum nelumboides]
MTSNRNDPGLPRFDSRGAETPFPPRTPNPYMTRKILITALIALVIITFFVAAYRIYVHLFWRRRRALVASWYRNQGESASSTGGLDKAIIDSLPTFSYTTGLHHDGMAGGPRECAVCLIEFQEDDACRLLPKCNHSFHTECIDKWFLSNTTCPMCRMHTEMVDTEKVYQVESTRACLYAHEHIDEQMPGLDMNLYGHESSSRMQRPRSRSTEWISLHQGVTNNIQRTRSISFFGGEHDQGLGLHMRQTLARTFSSRANGRYDVVGEETHIDMNTVRGNSMPNNSGRIAEGDVKTESPKVLVQHVHLPNWQRSASDKCLSMRQGLQNSTNVPFSGNALHPAMQSLRTDHWQMGGRSLPHISVQVQDVSFSPCSASSSPSRCVFINEQLQRTGTPSIKAEQIR